ncbi:MAG: hypothetical protein ABJA98_09835 [Acidobacteriota bacterium]
MVCVLRSLLLTLRTLAYSRAALHLEIRALRHQLRAALLAHPFCLFAFELERAASVGRLLHGEIRRG